MLTTLTWQPLCAMAGTDCSTTSGPFWKSSLPIQPTRGVLGSTLKPSSFCRAALHFAFPALQQYTVLNCVTQMCCAPSLAAAAAASVAADRGLCEAHIVLQGSLGFPCRLPRPGLWLIMAAAAAAAAADTGRCKGSAPACLVPLPSCTHMGCHWNAQR